jgi:hypothetical protein
LVVVKKRGSDVQVQEPLVVVKKRGRVWI